MSEQIIYKDQIIDFGKATCEWCESHDELHHVSVPRGCFERQEIICKVCLINLPERQKSE
jgi:hypothetical protein